MARLHQMLYNMEQQELHLKRENVVTLLGKSPAQNFTGSDTAAVCGEISLMLWLLMSFPGCVPGFWADCSPAKLSNVAILFLPLSWRTGSLHPSSCFLMQQHRLSRHSLETGVSIRYEGATEGATHVSVLKSFKKKKN